MPYQPFAIHTQLKRNEKEVTEQERYAAMPPLTDEEIHRLRNQSSAEVAAEMDALISSMSAGELWPRHKTAHPDLMIGDLMMFSAIASYIENGKRGSLAEAERALRLRQRSASAIISRIEKKLGMKLVEGKRTELTPQGRNLATMGQIWSHWYGLVMLTKNDQGALSDLLSEESRRLSETTQAREMMARARSSRDMQL